MLKKRSQSFSALFRFSINRTLSSTMLYGWTTKSGCNTPTPKIHLQRSGGELLLENTQHDGDAFFEAEKVTLTGWKDLTLVKILAFFDGIPALNHSEQIATI